MRWCLLLVLPIVAVRSGNDRTCFTGSEVYREDVKKRRPHTYCVKFKLGTIAKCSVTAVSKGVSSVGESICDLEGGSIICHCTKCSEDDGSLMETAMTNTKPSLERTREKDCLRNVTKTIRMSKSMGSMSSLSSNNPPMPSSSESPPRRQRNISGSQPDRPIIDDRNTTSPMVYNDPKAERELLMSLYMKLFWLFGAICVLMIIQLILIRYLRRRQHSVASHSFTPPSDATLSADRKSQQSLQSAISSILSKVREAPKSTHTDTMPTQSDPSDFFPPEAQKTPEAPTKSAKFAVRGDRTFPLAGPSSAVQSVQRDSYPDPEYYRFPRKKPSKKPVVKGWEWM
ncbi:hypothetical protein Q1695_007806 [Nippostrongylus brasiliensis]|nr:hypothetical protein Q1695_007806 [Nippostrongylus brasiliensis]